MAKKLHFNGLNGLRAIASISVLFAHTTILLGSFGLDPYIFGKNTSGGPKSTSLAGFGVTIFFALSGFLITYLLLEEKKVREINIKNFYMRRVLRIWPLYYLYFALSIFTLLIFDLPFEKKYVLFFIFLAANVPFIFGVGINFIDHYWSISVEEQFYLFWPWVIKKSKSILKVTAIICGLLIALKCIFRIIDIYYNQGVISLPFNIISVTRFQSILIGAIGAILYFKNNVLFLRITNNLLAQFIAWVIILLLAISKFHLISFLDDEFVAVVTVFLIIGQIKKNNRIINLDATFFDFIGKISFGVYVIHILVIFYLSKVISFSNKTSIYNYLFVYFSVFTTTVFLAYLSYEFFEKRFLRLKEKYS